MQENESIKELLGPGRTVIVFLGKRYRLSTNKLYAVLKNYYNKCDFITGIHNKESRLNKALIKISSIPLVILLDLNDTSSGMLEFLIRDQKRKKIIIIAAQSSEFHKHLRHIPLEVENKLLIYNVIDINHSHFTIEKLSLFRLDPVLYAKRFIKSDNETRYLCYEILNGDDFRGFVKLLKSNEAIEWFRQERRP